MYLRSRTRTIVDIELDANSDQEVDQHDGETSMGQDEMGNTDWPDSLDSLKEEDEAAKDQDNDKVPGKVQDQDLLTWKMAKIDLDLEGNNTMLDDDFPRHHTFIDQSNLSYFDVHSLGAKDDSQAINSHRRKRLSLGNAKLEKRNYELQNGDVIEEECEGNSFDDENEDMNHSSQSNSDEMDGIIEGTSKVIKFSGGLYKSETLNQNKSIEHCRSLIYELIQLIVESVDEGDVVGPSKDSQTESGSEKRQTSEVQQLNNRIGQTQKDSRFYSTEQAEQSKSFMIKKKLFIKSRVDSSLWESTRHSTQSAVQQINTTSFLTEANIDNQDPSKTESQAPTSLLSQLLNDDDEDDNDFLLQAPDEYADNGAKLLITVKFFIGGKSRENYV